MPGRIRWSMVRESILLKGTVDSATSTSTATGCFQNGLVAMSIIPIALATAGSASYRSIKLSYITVSLERHEPSIEGHVVPIDNAAQVHFEIN